MKFRRNVIVVGAIVATLAVVAIGAGIIVRTSWNQTTNSPAAADPYDEQAAIKAAEVITAEMIGYTETGGFALPFRESRALAIDDENRIYVAGDRNIAVFAPDGTKLADIALQGPPHCLAIGGSQHAAPGQIYVGMEEHVDVFNPRYEHVARWPSQGSDAHFTSITPTDIGVWVADAGNRRVWRYDIGGKLLKPVGQSNSLPNGTEFVVTNHYFDVAAGYDDMVFVVNPRLLRVEGYMQSTGDFETQWGHGSPAVADFFGCCNPAHLAVLPDDRFVTAEKGIPRVKIYSHKGEFETVVAGPEVLRETPSSVGGDRRGRILVLDAHAAKVRIFEKKQSKR